MNEWVTELMNNERKQNEWRATGKLLVLNGIGLHINGEESNEHAVITSAKSHPRSKLRANTVLYTDICFDTSVEENDRHTVAHVEQTLLRDT